MTSLWTLMGLLVLAYMGSFLFGGPGARGFGLASSAEYVVLGFLMGPHILGLLDRSTQLGFDPMINAAVGWLALVVGLRFGFTGGQRIRARSIISSSILALVTGGAIFGAVFLVLRYFSHFRGTDRLLLAGGIAVACAETTRHAVRWVIDRYGASGPLSTLVAELADSDDLVIIVATAMLFSLSHPATTLHLPLWSWPAITVGLGAVMGILVAALLGKEFRLDESWGVLLGASLLTIGLSSKIGLSPLTTMFVMGLTIAVTSRHRSEVVEMVAPTERAVLLPALLLAGGRVDLNASRLLPVLALVTILTRVVAKWLGGIAVRGLAQTSAPVSPWLGFGLLSTGGLAMSIGLAFALRFPGAIGGTVLGVAAAATIFGEFIGPASLRTVLRNAGEIVVVVPEPRPSRRPIDQDSPDPPAAEDEGAQG